MTGPAPARLRPAAAGQFEWILGPWLDESHGGGRRTVGWRAHPNDRPTDTLAVLLNFEASTYRSTWNSAGRGSGSSWPTSTGSPTCPPMAPATQTTRPPYTAPTAASPASPSPARAASSTNGQRPSRHPIGLARPPMQAAMWDPILLRESGATRQVLARYLPETALHVALRRPITQPSAASLSCAVMWIREVLQGVVNHPRINGMQGVRGSNPLSSTRHNASAGRLLRAVCQQIVSRSRDVAAITL